MADPGTYFRIYVTKMSKKGNPPTLLGPGRGDLFLRPPRMPWEVGVGDTHHIIA